MTRAEKKALEAYPVPQGTTPSGKAWKDSDMIFVRELFIQAYEQAEKDLGWISVKDRLPEENKWVFVCVDMQGVPQCVGLGYLRDGEWCDDENDNGLFVDYWMPIPELPKEEKK